MLKKIICMVLALTMVVSISACTSSSADTQTTSASTTAVTSAVATTAAATQPKYEEKELHLSNSSSPTSLTGEGFTLMKEYIEKTTGGKVKLNLHWQGSLFPQDQDLPSCMKGNVDFVSTQPAYIGEYLPDLKVLNSAYLFESFEHWQKFYASDTAKELFDRIAKEVGVRVLGVENCGTRTINLRTDKEVLSRADLKNVKLRMQNSDAWLFMGEALGGNPVPVAYADLYLALQTGTVDGSDCTLISIKDKCYYEVEKSVTMSQHVQETNWNVINEKTWQSLSPELQKVIQEGMDIETQYIIESCQKNQEEMISMFEEKGMKVYQPTTEELAGLRKEVLDYYMSHKDVVKEWDMDLYQKIQDLAA